MKKREQCPAGTCEELEFLRTQLKSLPNARDVKVQNQLESQLRERVKELDCLYRLTKLIEHNENSLDAILQGTVSLLPGSWQYPEIACARIRYRDQVFQSNNFRSTQWRQKAPIIISDFQEGGVEVHYLKKDRSWMKVRFLKKSAN